MEVRPIGLPSEDREKSFKDIRTNPGRQFVVYRMELDKTRWYCSWDSDQNCAQNSAKGWWGPRGRVGIGLQGVVEAKGVG